MSTWYKVTAFWGGLDGSLLFWVLVLALFSTIAIAVNAKRHRDMIGYVVATIMVVQVFFLSLLIFTKNPFATFADRRAPADGQGLNPLLQNYWMVIHPPSLYIGFVAATIPFAFGIGALASGRLDDMWIGSVRVVDADLLRLPLARPHPRRPLGLRGARLGRLLGVGSGRERGVHAVVHGDRVPPLRDHPGAARDDEALEPGARHASRSSSRSSARS